MNSAQGKSKTTLKVPPDIWNKKLFVCIKERIIYLIAKESII